jgi:2',3'-cyclic-nucleotide 2'-phosphodiesterase (5'-nucleotidase family)
MSLISRNEAGVTFLAFNDVYDVSPSHGWGGFAGMKTLIEEQRAKAAHPIVTLSGDFLGGNLLSLVWKGSQMIDMLNALGVFHLHQPAVRDVCTNLTLVASIGVEYIVPGNHEFDFGPTILAQRISESKSKWLCCNIFDVRTVDHTDVFVFLFRSWV